MTNATVLAGWRFVLKHHVELRSIVLVTIRTADQVHHLIALDGAGARKHRIRTDAGQIVDLKRKNLAGFRRSNAPRHAVLPCVDVGCERFESIRDKFHGPLKHDGKRHRREVIRVRVHLDSERTANVFADDANMRFRQTELPRVQILHHVRSLLRVMHGQPLLAGVEITDLAAWLKRHAGVTTELKCHFGYSVGFCESIIHAARVQAARETQIVAKIRVNNRRRRIKRCFGLNDRGQRLPLHDQILQCVFGLRACFSDNGHHGLALPPRAFDRQRILRRGLHSHHV